MEKEVFKAKNWFIDPSDAPDDVLDVLEKINSLVEKFGAEEIRNFILSIIQACMGPDDWIKSIKIKGQSYDGEDYNVTIIP